MAAAAGVDQIVVVEAAETVDETHFVLVSPRNIPSSPEWLAGSTLRPQTLRAFFVRSKTIPATKAFDRFTTTTRKIQWMKDTANDAGFRALADLNLSFDALVQDFHELPCVISVAERFPNLSIILNHCGKPDIASNIFPGWASDIERLAKYPNVVCKFPGF